MAFDQTTRNRLARFVGDCRGLLTEEFTRQLQSVYGMDPKTGDVAEIDSLTLTSEEFETARLLRATMDHYLASADTSTAAKAKKARIDVLGRIVREQAFTVLNRLCALRMSEARGLLIESIGKGYQSKGFQLYKQLAGPALGETGDAYRCFLFCVFDEFGIDLPVLFDRFSPEGRLFPRESALLEVLAQINDADIDPLWAEDETIGWIYQYFNSIEERKEMRAASQAPRNSRELAVRNQFFTPRYVVEFLTDNTLGRIWYEMTQGETGLKDSCRYLVRRPNEIFLAEGEEAPEQEESSKDLSQEELLQQPVYIPFCPLKDPRDIKMLDPACGSMHFGLYAFDLFERIYNEAWDLEAERGADAFVRPEGLKPLQETFDSKEAFLRDVPRLIIERNIHGIDIDPRAVQIAGLSLWLRAQKSWATQGRQAADRPQIQRSNIVCAEPMPGEADMLEEFLKSLRDDRLESLIRRVLDVPENQQVRATARMAEALCDLVRTVWKEMELAGEAGSLLRIEDSLAAAIVKGKEEWVEKAPLFRVTEFGLTEETQSNPKTKYYKTLPGEEADFWTQAELLVLTALSDFASQVGDGGSTGRSMFARDAARGFAFADLFRNSFDVALMNPPFGESSKAAAGYIKAQYPSSSQDIFQCFVERCIETSTEGGLIGVLSARTGFFMGASESWRLDVVWKRQLQVFADLGLGVLDDALVEAAAYTIKNAPSDGGQILASRHLSTRDKETSLATSMAAVMDGSVSADIYAVPQDVISMIPGGVFGYWAPLKFLHRFRTELSFETNVTQVRQGLATADDFRFVRLAWEIPSCDIGSESRWSRFSKGGEYSPPYDDIHLVVDWRGDGYLFRAFPRAFIRNDAYYYKPGATYTVRTASAFAAKILPRDCVFSHNAQSWFVEDENELLATVAYFIARVPQAYLELAVGGGDIATSGSAARRYTTKVIHSIPAEVLNGELGSSLARELRHLLFPIVHDQASDETSALFSGLPNTDSGSIVAAAKQFAANRQRLVSAALDASSRIDKSVSSAWSLDTSELEFVASEIGHHPCEYPKVDCDERIQEMLGISIDRLIGHAVEENGASRWITKKSYFVDRRTELISHVLQCHPSSIERALVAQDADVSEWAKRCVSHAFGVAIGRWSAVDSTSQTSASFVERPLNPLPQRPPAAASGTALAILEDDGSSASQLNRQVGRTLATLWPSIGSRILEELHPALGVPLHDWLRREFFAFHISQHSKSRRVAPVYWPLSSRAGSYTLWIYYHHVTSQSLYSCVNDHVEPNLKRMSEEAKVLRIKANRSVAEENELERLSDLELELKDFRDELLRIAKFWKPNLNDGVQITAAPLWRLFQHKAWQKRLKETWEKLEAGEYDWAHLALSIWPERVARGSHNDRSYAITHDLEDELWHEVEVEKRTRGGKIKKVKEWRPRDLSESELDAIVTEVKAR